MHFALKNQYVLISSERVGLGFMWAHPYLHQVKSFHKPSTSTQKPLNNLINWFGYSFASKAVSLHCSPLLPSLKSVSVLTLGCLVVPCGSRKSSSSFLPCILDQLLLATRLQAPSVTILLHLIGFSIQELAYFSCQFVLLLMFLKWWGEKLQWWCMF